MPEQGTVGASGDLAPLSHLALGLMGEGHMWSPETGWGDAKYVSKNLWTALNIPLKQVLCAPTPHLTHSQTPTRI